MLRSSCIVVHQPLYLYCETTQNKQPLYVGRELRVCLSGEAYSGKGLYKFKHNL